MTTIPQSLLSEQQIIDIAHQCDGPAADQSQTTAFARLIEARTIAAYAAKLAEKGVPGAPVPVVGEVTFGEVIGVRWDQYADITGGTKLVTLAAAHRSVAAARNYERKKHAGCCCTIRYGDEGDEGDDVVKPCAMHQVWRDEAVAAASPAPAAEPAMWQYRAYYDTCAGDGKPGWGAWEEVVPRNVYTETVADRVREIQAYIEQGKRYELRALYATPSPMPAATDLAHELWSAAQLAPGEGIEDGVRRIAALLPAAAGVEERAGLSDEECDHIAAQTMDAVAKAFGHEHALHLNTDISTFSPLRRELVRAGYRLASSAAQVPEGMALVPKVPTPGLLMSMALRFDHALGCPGHYDQPPMSMFGVTHSQRLQATLQSMSKAHEEVVGAGFYRPDNEEHYASMATAAAAPAAGGEQ